MSETNITDATAASTAEPVRGKVLLCVTGCIAAYKACEVLRLLQKEGCEVRVCLTRSACDFVGPTTFEALSGHPVALDLISYPESAIPHITLSEWADVVLVAPATGNSLAKMAHGIADDVVSSTLLASTGRPIVVAPAMNVRMWQNAATQANMETLRSRGILVVTPEEGLLACGDVGEGKLADVADIASATLAALDMAGTEPELAGKHVVITAGPTHEAIDPVRFIANASSGKMGYALARAARARGARVTLVSGPTALPEPSGVEVVHVTSAQQMFEAASSAFESADVAICAAAVADYTPVSAADHKLKKGKEPLSVIELKETVDILASLSRSKGERVVVGFAAETNDLLEHAQAKVAKKGCDFIVANDVSKSESTFGSDTNRISFVFPDSHEELPLMSKESAAQAILSKVAELLRSRGNAPLSC